MVPNRFSSHFATHQNKKTSFEVKNDKNITLIKQYFSWVDVWCKTWKNLIVPLQIMFKSGIYVNIS